MLDKALPVPDFRMKQVLSEHDMKSDEGKAAGLKRIVGILAEVESLVERERLIRHLAKFHPNFSTGTTLAEDHLRAEVARLRAGRPVQRNYFGSDVKKETARTAAKPLTKLSLAERSEQLLLGIIIFQGADASKVFEVLPAKEFTEGGIRTLAEAVSRLCAREGKIDGGSLRNEVAGTPAEGLLTDILIGFGDSDANYTTQDLVGVITKSRMNERRHRMRSLAERIASGEIKHEDPEYEEWSRLVKETSSPWRR
jgi:hypothetical protein